MYKEATGLSLFPAPDSCFCAAKCLKRLTVFDGLLTSIRVATILACPLGYFLLDCHDLLVYSYSQMCHQYRIITMDLCITFCFFGGSIPCSLYQQSHNRVYAPSHPQARTPPVPHPPRHTKSTPTASCCDFPALAEQFMTGRGSRKD